MAKHTLELDDLELTALITHLEGQSEMTVSYTHLTLPTITGV